MQDHSDSTRSGARDSEQPVSAPPAPRRGRPVKKAAQRGAYSIKHYLPTSRGLSKSPAPLQGQETCQTQPAGLRPLRELLAPLRACSRAMPAAVA